MASTSTPAERTRAKRPLADRLAALDGMIQRLRVEAAAGKNFDLTPLENRVGELCRALEQLPVEEARQLRVSLLALIDDLDRLTEQLKGHLEQLQGELGAAGERRRAARAYAGKKSP